MHLIGVTFTQSWREEKFEDEFKNLTGKCKVVSRNQKFATKPEKKLGFEPGSAAPKSERAAHCADTTAR